MTTVDPADEVACLHTCIPRKFYFMFGQDAFNTDRNEPSSDEDEEGEDKDEDELFHGASCRQPQRFSSSPVHPHNLSIAVHPPSAHSPTPLMEDPPTLPVVHSNPLQWGESLVELSFLPCCIWTNDFIPSPGCYSGVFTRHQLILDKVYQLASSSSPYSEMIIRAQTVDALAVKLWTLLEHAALKGDFTDVLSQHRTFQVWVYSHSPAVCWWQIASI